MAVLEGKTAIITGGASGIGFGIAQAFAEAGAQLFLTDVKPEALCGAACALEKKFGARVRSAVADGSDEAAVKRAIGEAAEHFKRIDVVVNNAQASKSGLSLEAHTRADFALAIDTGLYATFYYMKHAFPYLKASKGCVINFASGAGMAGGVGQASYAAAKEGIRALSRVAAREWGEHGVNVNVVCPLAMTPSLEKFKQEYPERYADNIKNIPLGRFGDPKEDIGRVCVFLASDAASYISGETISVQGGSGLRP